MKNKKLSTPAKKAAVSLRDKTPRPIRRPKPKKELPPPEKIGLFNLRVPAGAHKKRKLLGRGPGSGHGKTSTRGSKGQTSRAGRDFYAGFEGGQSPLIRKIPKRGFTSIFKKEYQIVNLADLNRLKESEISLELLEKRGLIKDKSAPVKILGDTELKLAVVLEAHAASKSAREKIKAAGGSLKLLNV
jgi:large subunit ribosomal protein L15